MEAQFGLGLKCLFRLNPNLFKSCSLLRVRGNVFQILAPLNLKEAWYLVVRASDRARANLADGDGANLYGACYMNGNRARG